MTEEKEPVSPECAHDQETIDREFTRWKNRRRMAWISLGMMIGLIQEAIFLAIVLPTDMMSALSSILMAGMFVFASIVGAYMGMATISEASFWTKR